MRALSWSKHLSSTFTHRAKSFCSCSVRRQSHRRLPRAATAFCDPGSWQLQTAATLGQSLSAVRGRLLGKRRAASSAVRSTNGSDSGDDLWLLVGLGNPGPRYDGNRHNVGFHLIDRLSREEGIAMDRKQCNAIVGRGQLWGNKVLLAKPQTFMNSSGKAVRRLVDYYKVPHSRVLVVYDDLDTPTAKLRLRAKGGHGGHNGMRSIAAELGNTLDFPRLRIGIGRPPGQMQVADYVLQDFSKVEKEDIEFAMRDAVDTLKAVLVEGMDRAISGVRT